MQETWVQSLGWEDPLEEKMATHSSTLAWKIPWTEEPGGAAVHRVAKSRTRLIDFTSLKCTGWLNFFCGEGNHHVLQYSCLGKPMDRGAWQATVHGVAESDMT